MIRFSYQPTLIVTFPALRGHGVAEEDYPSEVLAAEVRADATVDQVSGGRAT